MHQSGLGVALLQSGQPMAYASRALSKVEQRYAQIKKKKKLFTIVFDASHFDQYILVNGKDVFVEADHKPL